MDQPKINGEDRLDCRVRADQEELAERIARALAPLVEREIVYRLLKGEQAVRGCVPLRNGRLARKRRIRFS